MFLFSLPSVTTSFSPAIFFASGVSASISVSISSFVRFSGRDASFSSAAILLLQMISSKCSIFVPTLNLSPFFISVLAP